MEELGRLTETQRAEAAARVVEAVPKGRLAQFVLLLRNLPLLLRRHGLGQTLAYLQGRAAERADSPYTMLYRHLGSWLGTALGLQGDALVALSRLDSVRYLQAAEETHAFVAALRRAAEEKLNPSPSVEEAQP